MRLFSIHPSSLRIALVASSLAQSGAEKQFVYAARALRQAGVDVCVFHLESAGYYASALQQASIPICSLACTGKPLRMLWRLLDAFRTFRPNIVVASQFGDITHATTAGRLVNALTIGGVRNDGFWELETYGRRSPWMLRWPHGLIANSHCARNNLVSRGANADKIHVVGNVIDLEQFDAASRNGSEELHLFAPNRVVVAAVGRLNQTKRFDRFLEALAAARKVAPALAGVVVGGDEGERGKLEQQAKKLGLSPDHLVFSGPTNNVPALLRQTNMLVLTSESEGVPNVILEAMAARLPVVTTLAGDAALLVQDGVTGFVVGFTDLSQLADRMVRLAQRPDLRKQFGEAGRKRIELEYNFEGLADRLLSTYGKIAQAHANQQMSATARPARPCIQPLID